MSGEKISEMQGKRMPQIVSTTFCIYNIVNGLFFLVVAIAHLAMQPTGCDEITWGKGCMKENLYGESRLASEI